LLPDSEKKPTFVYIDEAHVVIKKDPKIADIIDELRSARIGLVLAHQKLRGQIDDITVQSSLENCAIKMVNVSGGEIEYFSKLMDFPVDKMKNLEQRHFATYTRGKKPPHSITRVPLLKVPFRTMTPAEEAALKARMKEKYGVEQQKAPQAEPSHPATEATGVEPTITHEVPQQQNRLIVRALINNIPVSMLLDTGATKSALTQKTAQLLGLSVATLDYSIKVNTANGTALTACVVVDQISVGLITERKLPVLVFRADALDEDLLGMNFLDRLASWEVRDGRLILRGKKQEPPPTSRFPSFQMSP
jgi:clan AA aspartic protease (TIGR02281 family)